MKSLGFVVVLLAMLQLSAPEGGKLHAEPSTVLDTEISPYLEKHSRHFLERMKGHFDNSLDYLFTSYAFSGQSVQRPGMGKVLMEESDRHWQEGIGALKKYLQRGGKTFHADPVAGHSQERHFKDNFVFAGTNTLTSNTKEIADLSSTYLKQLETLVENSKLSAITLNHLHEKSMHRKSSRNEISIYDADMAHYLEEKLEDEISITRKFSNLYTNLAQMIDVGMSVHFFDQIL